MSNIEFQNNSNQSPGLKFTVVTVALNTEKVIEKTIGSVLNQTFLPYEYIIIDGASTDKTVEIANKYLDQFAQKKVKYSIISEKDSGVFNAMNKGIRLSTGDFISFLNAGDWYELDALQKIKSFYDEEPFELTYGGLHYIMLDGRVINKMSRMDHFLISTRNWNHPSMFLKREIYQKYGFGESFKTLGDFDLFLKLRKDGTKIRVIDDIITNYVADGLSTNPTLKLAFQRAAERYRVYRGNGYSRLYWVESYGWEFAKSLYLYIHKLFGKSFVINRL